MPSGQMNLKRRLNALSSRWGIETSGSTAFVNFRTRFLMRCDDEISWNGIAGDGTERRFAFILGASTDLIGSRFFFESAKSLPAFLMVAQQFLWAMQECESEYIDGFITALREAKQHSPGIDFGIARRGNSITLYPEGVKELDAALVEEPLEWLGAYPKVAGHFEEALKIVLARDTAKYRNALDNLRWSLEQLLRAVLKNRKPIEKQSDILLPWLKEKGIHQQVLNMYLDLLKRFAQYQNDAVKHGDAWSPAELEMVIYITGALMRMLLQLSEEEEAEAPSGT
jgi:hypothetical protein